MTIQKKQLQNYNIIHNKRRPIMAQEIYLIDDGNELKNKLTELFKKEKRL